jgi:hypothetical protein
MLTVSDEFERNFQPGIDEDSIPATPIGLANAFRRSLIWSELVNEVNVNRNSEKVERLEEFSMAVTEGKRKHTPSKSVFSTPFHKQVWGNVKQLTRLRWSSKLPLYSFFWTWISIPFIVSSLVFKFSNSSNDTFIRVSTLGTNGWRSNY